MVLRPFASNPCTVFQVAHQNQHQSYYRIQYKDIAVVKEGVELGKEEQQEHSPGKAAFEILSAVAGIAQLDVKAESEQEREGGVCLSGKESFCHD